MMKKFIRICSALLVAVFMAVTLLSGAVFADDSTVAESATPDLDSSDVTEQIGDSSDTTTAAPADTDAPADTTIAQDAETTAPASTTAVVEDKGVSDLSNIIGIVVAVLIAVAAVVAVILLAPKKGSSAKKKKK